MNTRVKVGGPGTKQRGEEMNHLTVSILTELPRANTHAASLNDAKRSEVNELQFGMHIECFFLIIFVFPNEKKQEITSNSWSIF